MRATLRERLTRTRTKLAVLLVTLLTSALITHGVLVPSSQALNHYVQTISQLVAELRPSEHVRLARGELVSHPQARRWGRYLLLGGESWQIVNASVSDVWQVVLDPRLHSRTLPGVTSATMVRGPQGRTLVRLTHRQGPMELSYCIREAFWNDEHRMEFRLDRSCPHGIYEGFGSIIVHEVAPTRALLKWKVFSDVGHGFIAGFLRPTVQEWMLRVPSTLKAFVERRVRTRRPALGPAAK